MREYSIPSVKKSGRISIPEDSFQKIRHARDLHKEGLGTGAVRLRLSGTVEDAPDTGEIAVKLDRLSRDLESLKGDPKALEEASSPHALRTILARQSLLMSAVFNLTEMVETLLRSNGQPRRPAFEEESELRETNAAVEGPETRLARSRPVGKNIRLSSSGSSRATRSERGSSREFGSLARRRRRALIFAAVALVAILALAAVFYAIAGGSSDTSDNAPLQATTQETISVPDLTGLTYTEAEIRLEEAGLALEEREDQEGEIVGQNPEPDTEASEGDAVSVTLDADEETSPGAEQYGEDVFEFSE